MCKRLGGEPAKSRALPSLGGGARNTGLACIRLHRPEERDFFTTANLSLRPGNRRDLSSRATLSDRAARALPLSYRRCRLTGLEPATTSLTAKYQTSSPPGQKGLSGNRRDGNDICYARRSRGDCPQPASRRPLRRAPPRYVIRCRLPRPLSWRSGLREVSGLFTTDNFDPGEQAKRLFFAEGIRVFTTWKFKNLLVSNSDAAVGLETKPLRSVGSGGVRETELWKGPKPFRLRE